MIKPHSVRYVLILYLQCSTDGALRATVSLAGYNQEENTEEEEERLLLWKLRATLSTVSGYFIENEAATRV